MSTVSPHEDRMSQTVTTDKQTSHATEQCLPKDSLVEAESDIVFAAEESTGHLNWWEATSTRAKWLPGGRVQRGPGTPGVLSPGRQQQQQRHNVLCWPSLCVLFLCTVNVLHRFVDRLQVLWVSQLQLCVRDVVGASKL